MFHAGSVEDRPDRWQNGVRSMVESGSGSSDGTGANGGGGGRVVDRADFDPKYDPSVPIVCEMCGGEMRYVAACKIFCFTCGYRRDCSDP